MHRRSSLFAALCALVASLLGSEPVLAQGALLNQVTTLATSDQGVPLTSHTFTTSTAGDYDIALVDLGAALNPTAPLASVELAVTLGSTIVGTPLSGPGTTKLTLAAGTTYTIRVVGAPGPKPGSGPISLQVTNVADASTPLSVVDVLALPPSGPSSGQGVVEASFTASTTGSYQIVLTDLGQSQAAPLAPLSGALTLILLDSTGAPVPGGLLPSAGGAMQTAVALQQGATYKVFAVGALGAGGTAGLFATVITPTGANAPDFSRTVPVGIVTALGSVTLASSTSYALSLADLKFPKALAQAGAWVTRDGNTLAALGAAGAPTSFTAGPAGGYLVFGLGVAAAASAGAYAVDVGIAAAPPLLHAVRGVTDPGATIQSYVFSTAVATAGSYKLDLADFAVPAALSSASLQPVQGSATVGSPAAPGGSVTSTLASGNLDILVAATPASGGGIFGFDVVPAAGGSPIFQASQGVGALFTATQIAVTTSGSYDVTVADVGFPGPFATLYAVVTRGTQNVGSIFGGGKFSFTASTGNYLVNFIATPSAAVKAGTFALSVTPTPPAPTVTLTANGTQVASGGTVTLTWSTQNATACVGSGGWSGALATSGSQSSPAITASTTFTLTCSGAGGSAAQSVTVTLAQPSKGGGALDPVLLTGMSILLAFVAAVRRRRLTSRE